MVSQCQLGGSMQQYKVGDLVGIGWNGRLKRPCPAIVVRVLSCLSYDNGYMYVLRTLDEDADERWCDGTNISHWETDK